MRTDKLTSKFQMALADAQSLALGRDHQFIDPLHLMRALLDQQGGSVRPLLDKSGVKLNALRSQLGDALDRLLRFWNSLSNRIYLSTKSAPGASTARPSAEFSTW